MDIDDVLSGLAGIDYWDHEVDLEPFDAVSPESETADWFRAWTDNPDADGGSLRPFAQDGSGGQAAVWRHHPGRRDEDQPVVFLGSEGESGVVAPSLGDFVLLLAAGIGPYERVGFESTQGEAIPEVAALAEKFGLAGRPVDTIVADARADAADFDAWLKEQLPAQ